MKPLLTSRRCQWAVSGSPLHLTGPLATGPPWSAQGGGLPQILLGTGWSTALPYSRTENLFKTSFIAICHTTQSYVWSLHSPDKMADLCSPQFSLVWRTILISGRERVKDLNTPCCYGTTTLNTGTDTCTSNLLCQQGVQNKALPVSWSD